MDSSAKSSLKQGNQLTFVRRGWRRVLPFFVFKIGNKRHLRIFPIPASCWTVVFIGCIYLGGGIGLYLNDRYRHRLDEISLLDRLYPPRWPNYRVARGNAYIRQATTALENGEFATAFHQLRAGVARAPGNREGRVLLAQFMSQSGRPDMAEAILVEGVDLLSRDEEYVQTVVNFLFARQNDGGVLEIAVPVLQDQTASPALKAMLAMAGANALFNRGHFDQSEDLLGEFDLLNSTDGRLLAARIEWERGLKELALIHIDELSTSTSPNAAVYRTQLEWLRDLDRHEKARQQSILHSIRTPGNPTARIDLLYAYARESDSISLNVEINELFTEFGSNERVLLTIGDFAANTGNADVAQRVLVAATEQGFAIDGPTLMLVESLIVSGRYREAIERTRKLLENDEWTSRLAPVFNGLQAIAYYALGDSQSARLFLNDFLNLQSIRAENMVAVSKRLESVGALAEARLVLRSAVTRDALNQSALTRLIELDLTTGFSPDLVPNLQHLLTMRRSSPDLLARAYSRLASDHYALTQGRDDLLDQLAAAISGNPARSTVAQM